MRTVGELLEHVKALQNREQQGEDVRGELATVRAELEAAKDAQLRGQRQGSRYAGPGSTREVADLLADGGAIPASRQVPAVAPVGGKAASGGLSGVMTKALAEGTPSAGGYLVEPQVSAEVLTLMRSRSAIMRLGPTVVPVKKSLAVTSISTGASAAYTAENAHATVSEETFAQSPLLEPKELVAMVPISNRLLRDAAENPSVEQVIRKDLAEIMALRQDLAFLQGTGGSEPVGLRTNPGLTPGPNLGANGATPTFDHLKDAVAALRGVNASFLRPGWVFHPRAIATLEKIKDTTGRYLADAGLLEFDATGGGGKLLGFPFVTSTQIPTNLTKGTSTDCTYILFGSDWQELWVGENEELVIEASDTATYTPDGGTTWKSAWQARQHVFRAVMAHDAAPRRPFLFTAIEGVRA